MTRIVVFRALTVLMVLCATTSAVPVHLRCEYLANPLGIDRAAPHLSWQSDDSERNWKQAAYEILVASSPDRLLTGNADVWDSDRKDSAESVDIAYAGPDLQSRRRYYWKICAWDIAGHVSESLKSAWWEMGFCTRRTTIGPATMERITGRAKTERYSVRTVPWPGKTVSLCSAWFTM